MPISITEKPFISKNEFKAILKELNIGKPFASKIISNILKNSRDDIWKKSIELLGFELESYLDGLIKTSQISNFKTLMAYNIYLFSIIRIFVEYSLEANGIDNYNVWIEKQLFTSFLRKLYLDDSYVTLRSFLTDKFNNIRNFKIKIQQLDYLKIIYEEIFPAKIRKVLGEFYTPDWLIEFILNNLEVEDKSFIDPACGSGSFLIQILQNKLSQRLVKTANDYLILLDSIIGFDINPITVQIARLNLLLTGSHILNTFHQPIIMPIYFADSLFNPFIGIAQSTSKLNYYLENQNKDQNVYFSRNNLQLLIPISEIPINKSSIDVASFLRNMLGENLDEMILEFVVGHFLAFKSKKHDIAIGNPPWLAWDGINSGHRNLLAQQWKFLFTQEGWRAKIAAGRVDLSAMFVYASQMSFLKPNAQMIFVLPLSLFKSKAAAEGFRNFKSKKGIFKPIKIWDYSNLAIFPNASNKALVALFELGKQATFPVQWILFNPTHRKRIPLYSSLTEVINLTEKQDLISFPVSNIKNNSPWVSILQKDLEIIKKLEGKSFYRARGGINTGGANTIFWVERLGEKRNLLKIRNVGKSIRAKNKVIEGYIEPEMFHPMIRGRNIKRWTYTNDLGILVPYIPANSSKKAIPEDMLEKINPYTFQFLSHFKKELINRKEYKRWGSKGPFYELYRIGPYTFAPYKVMWQHTGLGTHMKCCVVSYFPNQVLMDQKVIFVSFELENEAHYVCALLNSDPALKFLKSYLILDASTHILEHLNIPKFDSKNETHLELSKLSSKCHNEIEIENTHKFEREINRLAVKIWNLQ